MRQQISMALRALLVVFMMTALWLPAAARAEKRVALVIGNSAYENTSLSNPVNDATDLAAVLGKLGFEVLLGTDMGLDAIDQIRAEFEKRVQGADVALLFYAGHGIQFANRNFLVPTSARLQSERAIARETVALDEIIDDMQKGARITLVFLDACRNNPVARSLRSAGGGGNGNGTLPRGLAAIEPKPDANILVVFATAPGQVAEDGVGRNSPFTEALLRHIRNPADIQVMLNDVASDVSVSTGKRQQPERLSRLKTGFRFVEPASPPVLSKQPALTAASEREQWNAIQSSTDPDVFKSYLAQFPGGPFSNAARAKLKEFAGASRPSGATAGMDPEVACNEAHAAGSTEAQKRFIDRFPTHKCADTFRKMMRVDADQLTWERTQKSAMIGDFKKYLEAFPDGSYARSAKERIAILEGAPTPPGATPPPLTRAPTPIPDYSVYTPPPPRAAPPRRIQKMQYRWVKGSGYAMFRDQSFEVCSQRCQDDPRCQMVEYYFGREDGGKKCNLFDHQQVASEPTNEAHVGRKLD
jgi:uncharacterized caspase-like protein